MLHTNAAGRLRKHGRFVAACVLAVGAVGAITQPAAAAVSYNIVFIGKDIPAKVRSVVVANWETGAQTCAPNLKTGEDKNTGLSVQAGQHVVLGVYSDPSCQTKFGASLSATAPADNGGLKNWWVSLRGVA
ncbi:hypothetical protein JNUCC0626_47610 [Lentzea sp. JNUCC 0626]|uniref:hypothetical protein n=1 Tax=Lentzea sp. JNUCC 0626 TaxID=3367513 RepID=UPI00374A1316